MGDKKLEREWEKKLQKALTEELENPWQDDIDWINYDLENNKLSEEEGEELIKRRDYLISLIDSDPKFGRAGKGKIKSKKWRRRAQIWAEFKYSLQFDGSKVDKQQDKNGNLTLAAAGFSEYKIRK